jgi:hypothetical protein
MSGQDAARKLVADIVDSFEKLEIVVFVHRSGYRVTAPAEIAKGVSIALPIAEIEHCVAALNGARVLELKGPWAPAVAELVELYDHDRIEVLNMITRSTLARARKESARLFADAFVLRKKKKEEEPDA